MRKAVYLTAATLLLAACSNSSNNGNPPSPWMIGGNSVGMPKTMTLSGSLYKLDFPPCPNDHVDYVYKNTGPLVLGNTVAMSYTIAGSGELAAPGDGLPATLHLFLQREGDDWSGVGPMAFYRLWSTRTVLALGGNSISQQLEPSLWTGVFGANPTAAEFTGMLNNIAHIGFTFGGSSFAGHGVCANAPTTFTLTGYQVKSM